VRINSGGAAFLASGNRQFGADQYFGGTDRTGSIASGDILNTTDDVLYRSERSSPAFNYAIPVTNGTMNVVLHFAETWWGAPGGGVGGTGKRMFHVDIEGSRKLTNYDIFVKAGGAMRAVQETFAVTVTDGTLNINFVAGTADMPKISAIEVVPQTTLTNTAPVLAAIGNKTVTVGQALTFTATATDANTVQTKTFSLVNAPAGASIGATTGAFTWTPTATGTFTFAVKVTDNGSPALSDDEQITVTVSSAALSTVRINSGGSTASTSLGTFAADHSFAGSTVDYTTTTAIANTTDDVIYQTYRRPTATTGGVMSYNIPVANGTYTVKLHFAETAHTAAGARKFNVSAEGISWLSNYDIFVAAGNAANRAVVATKSITVADGSLTLDFTSLVNRACVSAIEVVPQTTLIASRIGTDEVEKALAEENKATMGIYPNPNPGDKVSVELTGFGANEEVTLTIHDLQGRLIHTEKVAVDASGAASRQVVFRKELSSGGYLITGWTVAKKVSAQLIVQ
jgi:hypothetical protein